MLFENTVYIMHIDQNKMLIILDGERNHSMGSPMDGTPPQSKDR